MNALLLRRRRCPNSATSPCVLSDAAVRALLNPCCPNLVALLDALCGVVAVRAVLRALGTYRSVIPQVPLRDPQPALRGRFGRQLRFIRRRSPCPLLSTARRPSTPLKTHHAGRTTARTPASFNRTMPQPLTVPVPVPMRALGRARARSRSGPLLSRCWPRSPS